MKLESACANLLLSEDAVVMAVFSPAVRGRMLFGLFGSVCAFTCKAKVELIIPATNRLVFKRFENDTFFSFSIIILSFCYKNATAQLSHSQYRESPDIGLRSVPSRKIRRIQDTSF